MALIELNANINKQTEELQQKMHLMSDVERAIKMLRLAMKVLGKIKATLEHLRGFWNFQRLECDILSENCDKQIINMQKIQDRGKKRGFEIILKASIVTAVTNWITLYKLNANAYVAIKESQTIIDSAVGDFGQYDEENQRMLTQQEILDRMKGFLNDYKRAYEDANIDMITEE